MTTKTATTRHVLSLWAAAALLASAFALFPSAALAAPAPVPAPVIPGAAPLPGPVAPPAKASDTMGLLKVTPDTGAAGAPFTLSGNRLGANKDVSIVWTTSNVNWVLDARPDSVDYIGQSETKGIGVVLATTKTDAKGAFTISLKAPRDFGAIHDIYAVIDGVQVAKGGYLISRTLRVTPLKGPIGTPITIRIGGLGSTLYGGSASVWWDGRYAGVATAKWTRGEATVQIRAAGPVGKHTLLIGTGMQFNYLNIQQSPIPWATGGLRTFVVTRDAGPPPTRTDWPVSVKPTVDTRTTMSATGLDATGGAGVKLGSTSGAVGRKVALSATGLAPNQPVELALGTVVGNRVNCTGTCWTMASVPLGSGKAAADGSLQGSFEVPDGLGGWHVVQVLQGGQVRAQVPYFIERSVISVPRVVKAGHMFQVHLKGVGWTQLDNTVAVTYDNGYVGYGCGFNSQGDVVLNLAATGGPGTHLIDIYPLLYPYQPAYAYPPHAAVPFLSFARDYPGLALGYRLPAFRLAVKVVA
ncbi:MAG: hypothetical protein ACM3QU_12935 [Verrucomicrobiota bacterium]